MPSFCLERKRKLSRVVLAGGPLLACLALPAAAIVMRHDIPAERYTCDADCAGPTALFHLGSRAGGGTGTLVAPRWVLTAAHVAQYVEPGDPVTVRGQRMTIERTVLHPRATQTDGFVDVALVELSEAADGVAPARVNGSTEETGLAVRFVGAGAPGDGQDGLRRFDGKVRHADNKIERTWDHWLEFRFDDPEDGKALPLEGISGPGDSGGPAYRADDDDSAPCLLGVSSWQNNRAQEGVEGVYGVLEQYVRTSSVFGWIEVTIADEGFPRACG